MCLRINKSIKEKKPNKDGFCTGWKIIKKDNLPLIYGKDAYEIGLNVSNRTSINRASIDTYESDMGIVNFSFHLFLDKKGAKKMLKYREIRYGTQACKTNEKLIKVFYKPEDVVAYGTMQYVGYPENETQEALNRIPNVVVDQLTIKSLKKESL